MVPVSTTSSGMTLKAWPPCTEPMVTTADSTGETSRDTIVCSATTTWAAATMGSAARCGLPPWPPRPWTTMRSRSTAAISGPSFTPIVPTGSSFQRWTPSTTSTPSSPPSRMTAWAPPSPSSAGWKSTRTVPARPRATSVARRRHRHGHVTVVAAGVHQAGDAGGVGRRAVLLDGQRVHVGAQEHGRSAAAARARDHSRPAHARAHVEAGRLEEGGHPRRRPSSPRRPAPDAGAARAAARPCPACSARTSSESRGMTGL